MVVDMMLQCGYSGHCVVCSVIIIVILCLEVNNNYIDVIGCS